MLELIAQTATETDWVTVTRDLGFPIAAALALLLTFLSMFSAVGFALWRIGVWIAPLVQRATEAHIGTMETFQETAERQTVAMEEHAVALSSLTETARTIARTQSDMQREMTEQRKLHEKVCDRLATNPPLVNIDARGAEVKEVANLPEQKK